MNTETQVAHKTCKVTIVSDGGSDRVIKITPAEHENEKIFLNNTPGKERWEAVRRLMNNYAQRGTRVPEPVPYHDDVKNLAVVTLRENDIPTVTLDGVVFQPLKEAKVAAAAPVLEKGETQELKDRLARLEALLAAKEEGEFVCDVPACGKPHKTKAALAMHVGRFHKEDK